MLFKALRFGDTLPDTGVTTEYEANNKASRLFVARSECRSYQSYVSLKLIMYFDLIVSLVFPFTAKNSEWE